MANKPISPNSFKLPLPTATVKPVCPFFFECGGCDSQDVAYSDQVAFKSQWLRLLFSDTVAENLWQPFLHSPDEFPLFFRNKIRFGFVRRAGKVSASRHRKGEENADIPVDACFLQSKESIAVMNFTAEFAERQNWTLYDAETRQGWLKHLLIRQSKASGDMMLSLVTDQAPLPEKELWIDEVTNRFPYVKSLWQTLSWGKSNERLEDIHLWGSTTIQEKVGESHYHISPQAFFQTNGSMVHTLYEAIRSHAKLTGEEIIWDLYAGSATIGLYLHNEAKQVICIERNAANITDAAQNIAANNATNVTMIGNSVEAAVTSKFIQENGPANVIIVDPPRAGLAETLRRILPNLPKHRLVYVSCNPATCLRDVKELLSRGYIIESLQGLDMFPHTYHCEMIATLQLKA